MHVRRHRHIDTKSRQIRHETKQNGKIIGPRWSSGAVIKCESTIREKEGLVGVVKKFNFMQWFEAKRKFNKLK